MVDVDVFFDNVGGLVLEAAIRRRNTFGRISLRGGISQYSSAAPKGPANYLTLLSSRVRVQDFIYFDYVEHFDEVEAALAAWLFDGANRGKLVVRISDEIAA